MTYALTVDDRRALERALVELYLDRVTAAGVAEPPTFDQAWLAHRQQIFTPWSSGSTP